MRIVKLAWSASECADAHEKGKTHEDGYIHYLEETDWSQMRMQFWTYGNQDAMPVKFAVDDVISTARAVYATLTLFEVPIFVPLYSQKEFEAIAQQVVELLLKGLVRR